MAAEPQYGSEDIDKEVKEESPAGSPTVEAESDNGNEVQSSKAEGEVQEGKPPAPAQDGPGLPPNGGLVAWLQVLGGWMLFFNSWGLLNTFGIFQTYYESGQLFTATSSNISWIGSIQALMVLIGGSFSGPIFDRGYFRFLLILGTFGIVFGHMMLSISSEYYQVLLTQGFVIGLGASCLFIPGVAILPTYFTSNIGLAIGLAASGSSTGGIIYPIMFYKLIDRVGFGWTIRILGFTALATLMIPIIVMKMRVKPAKPRSVIDWTAFKDFKYMLFVVGTIIGFIGLYAGLFYTSYYGEATKLTSPSLSFYLVPILNASSVLGRTLPNWLSDKVGPLNVIIPGGMFVGIVLLCYMAAVNAGGLIVTTLMFGFFSGVFIALPPVLFVALTPDKSKIGTRIGMGFAMIGVGALAGGPGGGSVLGTNNADLHWDALWTYAGVCGLCTVLIFLLLRYLQVGFKVMVKV